MIITTGPVESKNYPIFRIIRSHCSQATRLPLPLAEHSNILLSQFADQHELVNAEIVRTRLIADALKK